MYVTEHGQARIQRFDENGGFLNKWGGIGTYDGKDQVVVLATAHAAIDAAAEVARAAGVAPVVLDYELEGEARELGREHGALALACASGQGLAAAPCVLLSGGETTVTVAGRGRGGRNTEYLRGLALGLRGAPGISFRTEKGALLISRFDSPSARSLRTSVSRWVR